MPLSLSSTGKIFHDECIDLATQGWTLGAAIGSSYEARDTWSWPGRSANNDFIYKTWASAYTTFVLNYYMSSDQTGGLSHFAPRAYVLESPSAAADSLFMDYGTDSSAGGAQYRHRLGYYKAGGTLQAFTGSPYNPASNAFIPYKWTVDGANIKVYGNKSLFDSQTDLRTDGMKRLEMGIEDTFIVQAANSYPLTQYAHCVLCSSNMITVTGLGASSGRKVKFYRDAGTLVATSAAADGSGNVTFDAAEFQFGDWGFFVITDTDGTTAADVSDCFQVYGGDSYAWTSTGATTTFAIKAIDQIRDGSTRLHTPLVDASLDHFHIQRSDTTGGTFREIIEAESTDNVAVDPVPGGLLLDQTYTPTLTGTENISTSQKTGQSFTPAYTGTLAGIGVPIYRVTGAADVIAWRLFAADGDGYPTGAELASRAWFSGYDIKDTTGVYRYFGFDTPVSLTAGTKYVVYFELASGTTAVWRWQHASAAGLTGGEGVKYVSGAWAAAGYDLPIKTYIDTPEDFNDTVYYKAIAHDASHSVLATSAEYSIAPDIDHAAVNDRTIEIVRIGQEETYSKDDGSGNNVFDNVHAGVTGFGRHPMEYAISLVLGSKIYQGSKFTTSQLETSGVNQAAFARSATFTDSLTYGKLVKDADAAPTYYYRERNARTGWLNVAMYRLTEDTTYLQHAVDIAKGMVNYMPRASHTYNGVTEDIFYNTYTIRTPPLPGSDLNVDPNQNWQIALLFAFLYYENWASNPFYKTAATAVDDPHDYWAAGKTYAQAAADIISAEMNMGFAMQESSGKYRIALNDNSAAYQNTFDTVYGRYGLNHALWLLNTVDVADFATAGDSADVYADGTWWGKLNAANDNWLISLDGRPQWTATGYSVSTGMTSEAIFAIPLRYQGGYSNRIPFVEDALYSRANRTDDGWNSSGYEPEGSPAVAAADKIHYALSSFALCYILQIPDSEWLVDYDVFTPAAPSGLTAQVVGDDVQGSFTDNSSIETGVKVERSTTGAWAGEETVIETLAADATTFTDTGAVTSPGLPLYYRVRAVNGAVYSEYSNVAEAAAATTAFMSTMRGYW